MDDDILQEITDDELPKLRDFYKSHVPYATHIFSFLDTILRCRKTIPNAKICTIYSPNSDWKQDGTIIAIIEYKCYQILGFTLDKACLRLSASLQLTRKVNWNNAVFYALHSDHRGAVLGVIRSKNITIFSESTTDIWWLPKDKAVKFDLSCPQDYYIDSLKAEHALTIDKAWPHRYNGSLNYISSLIEINGGHGVFTKSNNKLVCWVLKNHLGTLGFLQVLDRYARQGLGTVIVKSLSKEIGRDGHNPVGTIVVDNEKSQSLFRKLGFEKLGGCSYLIIGLNNV